jgi:FkbM family methyltransferase
MSRGPRCSFVAFGTRGDVQPLALLATAFAEAHAASVTFVTHDAHAALLAAPLRAAAVRFVGIRRVTRAVRKRARPYAFSVRSSLPAAAWRGQAPPARGWHSEPAAREECVRAVAHAFAHDDAQGSSRGALIVCNLFALEGWHLAERLRVPCVVAAPYVVPYSMPAAFAALLRRELPALCAALRSAPDSRTGWRDVEHWMWPLWTERWGDWRTDRLGLPSLPLSACEEAGDGALAALPPPTPLLYGFSEALVDRPGYWPPAAEATGFWHAPPGWEAGSAPYEPPAMLRAFLDAPETQPVVLVTFGSMASLDGAVPHPRTLLTAIAAALAASRLRGVLLMDAGSALAAAWRAGSLDALPPSAPASFCGGWTHMLGVAASVPHGWLLPRCIAALHHAGSGTAAAAAAAGVPQVTCPLMYDQHFWAEKLAYLGVAPPPLSRARLVDADPRSVEATSAATELAAALTAATSPVMRTRAAELAATLRAEDGIASAVATLARHAARGDAAAAASAAAELLLPPLPCNEVADDDLDAPDVTPLVRVSLPGGQEVAAVSPEETEFLHREVFDHDVYLRHGFGAALPRGAVVLDVGANVGLFALRLAALFASHDDERAMVHALEPLPACFAALQANTRALRCVRAHRVGVVAAAAPGEHAAFTFFPRMAGNSTLHPEEKAALQRGAVDERFWAGARRVRCPVTTLSAYMAEHLAPAQQIALLKIDVEGAELDALRGVASSDWCRINAVVAEVHDVDRRADAVESLLRAAGFTRIITDEAVEGAPASCVTVYARRD